MDGTPARTYEQVLRTLSEASVRRHFDAFADIAWDDPAYAVDPADPRWALPASDPLGGHPWYRALPLERQVEIGLWRQASLCKVGLQFESVLIRGAMDYLFTLPNGTPEHRYLTHEVTEETHHTQMFQEFVNRAGADVAGAPRAFRAVQRFLPLAGSLLPEVFFAGVLAGEEPIDFVQKAVLRSGAQTHPLLQRIMAIHVAEEARHISFAHAYLLRTTPTLSPARRAFLSVALPVAMRRLCDVIMVPGEEITTELGVPRSVVREAYWRAPASRAVLRDMFGDVRALAEEAGLMNPVSRRLWSALGIAGRPSRHRSRPPTLAA